MVYASVRERFGLSAQIVIRLLSKVCDAYKLDAQTKLGAKTQRQFRKHGAISYDDRILKGYSEQQRINIGSIGNRLNIPYRAGIASANCFALK
ncbi:MAG: hypothetical protein ABI700_00335 [Chloroflexota bacterium]